MPTTIESRIEKRATTRPPSGIFAFRDVEFVERTPLTHNVDHYKFTYNYSSDPSEPIPSLSVVLVKTPFCLKRNHFTPIFNEDVGYIHLAIKNYGRSVSGALAEMKPGDKGIQISRCKPHFKQDIPFNKYKKVYLIGAGVGVAPLFQYMNSCLRDPNSSTKIKLIYSNHSEKDIIFKEELDELQREYSDRLEIVHVLKKISDENQSEITKYVGSRLNTDILKHEMGKDAGNDDVKVFVCGPKSFVRMVSGKKMWHGGALRKLDYKRSQVLIF
ncbi:unnamed protein product [Ambrosiozyma monospora]|uniref:Unnamed protein product n=1 Tax=Ambrosiozyma monospora TaxID=43982 RepID=A0A9W6Z3Z7_AMBMO|nr:unnamed protein product [Ambrosiozyma monospora]